QWVFMGYNGYSWEIADFRDFWPPPARDVPASFPRYRLVDKSVTWRITDARDRQALRAGHRDYASRPSPAPWCREGRRRLRSSHARDRCGNVLRAGPR